MERSISTFILCVGAIGLFAQEPMVPSSNAASAEEMISEEADLLLEGSPLTDEDTAVLSGVDLHTADVDPALIRSEDGLVIWPVPAGDILHIYCSGSATGNMPFEIVNMTGRVVLRGSIQGASPNLIEVDDLATGDHLLRVVDGRGIKQVVFNRIP